MPKKPKEFGSGEKLDRKMRKNITP